MNKKSAFSRWLISFSWASFIGWAMLFYHPSIEPPVFPYADKLSHAVLFAVLAYLLYASFLASGKNRPLIAGFLASAYGALLELGQRFAPGRRSDFWDFFADILGVIIVILVIQLRKREH